MSALETAYRNALAADSALSTAATGGVHQDVAFIDAADADKPLVLFSLQSASDDYTMSESGIVATYKVEGYARDLATATTLATRIQAVCSDPALTGYRVIEAARIGHLSRVEQDDAGKLWCVEGGTYSLQVEAA